MLLSSSKKSNKNLDSYCFVTSFWLFISEKWCTVNVPSKIISRKIRIRIHQSEAWILGSWFGSIPKCHGSATLKGRLVSVGSNILDTESSRSGTSFTLTCTQLHNHPVKPPTCHHLVRPSNRYTEQGTNSCWPCCGSESGSGRICIILPDQADPDRYGNQILSKWKVDKVDFFPEDFNMWQCSDNRGIMRPVTESNIFIAGLSELDWLLYNWRIFLTHYFGGFLLPYDSQISAVIITRIIRIHILTILNFITRCRSPQGKNLWFSNLCKTWGKIRKRIGIVLMLIRIRICIGINMEIRIRTPIDIKTMPIHNTGSLSIKRKSIQVERIMISQTRA
jgi:hypothetical protein